MKKMKKHKQNAKDKSKTELTEKIRKTLKKFGYVLKMS